MGLKFYNVEKGYADYLRQYEKQIPNIEYKARDKFLCGIVLTVNNMNYYVPVSSNKKSYASSFIIYETTSKGERHPVSSLRFSFMFPCPIEVVTYKNIGDEKDIRYRELMQAEYEYCNRHEGQIKKQAERIYRLAENPQMREKYHLNNFKLLEGKCAEYIKTKM